MPKYGIDLDKIEKKYFKLKNHILVTYNHLDESSHLDQFNSCISRSVYKDHFPDFAFIHMLKNNFIIEILYKCYEETYFNKKLGTSARKRYIKKKIINRCKKLNKFLDIHYIQDIQPIIMNYIRAPHIQEI